MCRQVGSEGVGRGGGLYSRDELSTGRRLEAGVEGAVRQEDHVLERVSPLFSSSSSDSALREVGVGVRRRWKSRACCASARQR